MPLQLQSTPLPSTQQQQQESFLQASPLPDSSCGSLPDPPHGDQPAGGRLLLLLLPLELVLPLVLVQTGTNCQPNHMACQSKEQLPLQQHQQVQSRTARYLARLVKPENHHHQQQQQSLLVSN
jgi:hypothetical protein